MTPPDPGSTLQYTFLHAELSKVLTGQPQYVANRAQGRSLTILSISSSTGQQVPLAVLPHRHQHRLVRSGHSYGVLTADKERSAGRITHSSLLSQSKRATTAGSNASRPSSISSRRLSLAGASSSVRPSITVLASTLPGSNATGIAPLQLQLQHHVPLCRGLQELPGHVMACCLLTSQAALQPHSQQQLWQQLRQGVNAACTSTAADTRPPEHVPKEQQVGSSTDSTDTLQVLAAAGAAAAAMPANCSCSGLPDAAPCRVSCSPVECCATLFGAFADMLQPSASTAGNHRNSSHLAQGSAPAPPLCMYLAGTCSGQVWLCTPYYALHGSSGSTSSTSSGGGGGSQQNYRRLLLDLQQPIVAILPLPLTANTSSAGSSSTAKVQPAAAAAAAAGSVLVVGSHGRIAWLQLQFEQRNDSTAGTDTRQAKECHTATTGTTVAGGLLQSLSGVFRLRMVQQQLPFAVVSAELLVQRDHHLPQQPLLLLLSSCGNIHAAEVTPADAHSSAAAGCQAAAAAAGPPGTAAAAAGITPYPAAAKGSGQLQLQLQLQTVKLPVPRAGCFWVLPALPAAAAGCGSSAAGRRDEPQSSTVGLVTSDCSTTIIVHLCGSSELIAVQADHVAAYVRQQLGAIAAASSSRVGAALGTQPAAAAAAARQQLTGLISALDVLADARRLLEQAVMSQDKYLTAVGQDMAALSGQLRVTQAPPPAAATTAAAVATGTRQPQLRCAVELTGIWPAPAAVGSSSISNSLHLAVTVQITGNDSSSNSSNSSSSVTSGSTVAGGLGPGWQFLVSFLPESARTPSWQTTVPASSTSSSSVNAALHAALLLPLPIGCGLLQEGGWLRVYAVKQPLGCLCREYSKVASVPAVALLAEKYVSTLQLSKLLAANHAADAVSKMLDSSNVSLSRAVAAASQVTGRVCQSAAAVNSSSRSYSCTLRFEAGAAAAAAALYSNTEHAALHALQLEHVAVHTKRLRQEAGSDRAHVPGQQQQEQSEHAVVPLGTALGTWLASVAHLPQEPYLRSSSCSNSSGFGAFAAMLQSGRTAGGFEEQQQQQQQQVLTLPGQSALALLHGQVAVRLAGNGMGYLSWAARPQLPDSGQQQQGSAAAAPATGGSSKGSGGHATLTGSNAVGMPVQVVLQASSVPALAQLHRAVMLAAVQQLECKESANSGGGRNRNSSSSSSRYCNGTSKHGRWQIRLQQTEQLRVGLQQLKQLQQQLLRLQDKADEFMDIRERVVAQVEALAATHAAVNTDGAAVSSCLSFAELLGCWEQWRAVVHAVYGRMLLAVSDVAYLVCQDV